MSFQNVLVNLICSLHIITFYKRFILYIRTHTKIAIIIFFWNFGIEPETKTIQQKEVFGGSLNAIRLGIQNEAFRYGFNEHADPVTNENNVLSVG